MSLLKSFKKCLYDVLIPFKADDMFILKANDVFSIL